MTKLMFTVAIAATAGSLIAEEADKAPAASEKTVAIAVAVETQTVTEGAQAIVDQAIEKAPVVNSIQPTTEYISAEELVEKRLNALNITPGYDSKKKAIIQIGTAVIKIEDPANDPGFVLAREQIANNAYLNAKADVIRAINTEFSATDRAMVAAEFGEDETAKKFAAKKAEMEEKKAELAALLAKLDAKEGQIVEEVTLSDRFTALLDGVIKRVDATYSPSALANQKASDAEVKKAEAAQIKERCAALLDEYKVLEAEAAKMPKDPAMETSSDVKALSKMPLLGSSVITQAESWDPEEKVYQVAVAVVWSQKLQEDAMRVISGDFAARSKKGKYSKQEWINAQDFGSMIGPRRFTDNAGNNLFVGISAADLKGPVVKQNASKKIADSMAMKAVAFSLAGDMETYREASQNLKVYEDDSKAALGKLSDAVSSKVTLNLNGCMKLASKTVKNPIMNRKIYISAYYIDPTLAAQAQGYMKKLFADAGLATKITQRKKGFTEGAQAALDATRASDAERLKGVADGAAAVKGEMTQAKTATAAASVTTKTMSTTVNDAPVVDKPSSANGGAYSGGTIDTDF